MKNPNRLAGLLISVSLVSGMAATSVLAENICQLDNLKGPLIILIRDKNAKDQEIRKVNIKVYNLIDKLTIKSKAEKQGKSNLKDMGSVEWRKSGNEEK